MIRRPPRSTQSRSSAASDVYKRQLRSSKSTKETGTKVTSRVDRIAARSTKRETDGKNGATDDQDAKVVFQTHVLGVTGCKNTPEQDGGPEDFSNAGNE